MARIAKHCIDCGIIQRHGSRCEDCDQANHQAAYGGDWWRISQQVVKNADVCHICGLPATADDPFETDHIIPVADGGSRDRKNLAAAHRSCNRSKQDR